MVHSVYHGYKKQPVVYLKHSTVACNYITLKFPRKKHRANPGTGAVIYSRLVDYFPFNMELQIYSYLQGSNINRVSIKTAVSAY